jgi:hypothetical protein
MKEYIERVLGFIVVVAVFIGSIFAAARYIMEVPERIHGAIAVGVALALLISGWYWVKDRVAKRP